MVVCKFWVCICVIYVIFSLILTFLSFFTVSKIGVPIYGNVTKFVTDILSQTLYSFFSLWYRPNHTNPSNIIKAKGCECLCMFVTSSLSNGLIKFDEIPQIFYKQNLHIYIIDFYSDSWDHMGAANIGIQQLTLFDDKGHFQKITYLFMSTEVCK